MLGNCFFDLFICVELIDEATVQCPTTRQPIRRFGSVLRQMQREQTSQIKCRSNIVRSHINQMPRFAQQVESRLCRMAHTLIGVDVERIRLPKQQFRTKYLWLTLYYIYISRYRQHTAIYNTNTHILYCNNENN